MTQDQKGDDQGQGTVRPVRSADFQNNTFDGKKADLFINTGKLGGKVFLVTVRQDEGEPVLIAVHL